MIQRISSHTNLASELMQYLVAFAFVIATAFAIATHATAAEHEAPQPQVQTSPLAPLCFNRSQEQVQTYGVEPGCPADLGAYNPASAFPFQR